MLSVMWTTVMRSTCWLALSLTVACNQTRETTPEEQQQARMNRELATLQQSVAALQARMDRVDGRSVGEAVGTATKPAATGADGSRPDAPTPGHDLDVDEHTLVVEVGNRAYMVDGKSVADADLPAALAAHKSSTSTPRLLLQAGPDIAYDRVIAAIDLAKAAGITHFALARTGSASTGPTGGSDAEKAQP